MGRGLAGHGCTDKHGQHEPAQRRSLAGPAGSTAEGSPGSPHRASFRPVSTLPIRGASTPGVSSRNTGGRSHTCGHSRQPDGHSGSHAQEARGPACPAALASSRPPHGTRFHSTRRIKKGDGPNSPSSAPGEKACGRAELRLRLARPLPGACLLVHQSGWREARRGAQHAALWTWTGLCTQSLGPGSRARPLPGFWTSQLW